MVSWLAQFKFFNCGHRLSGLSRETLGLDAPPRPRPRPGGREGLMGKFSRLGNELYNGQKSIDFVGRRALWYAISALLVGARDRRRRRQAASTSASSSPAAPSTAITGRRAASTRTTPTSSARRSPTPASTDAEHPIGHHGRQRLARADQAEALSHRRRATRSTTVILDTSRRRPRRRHLGPGRDRRQLGPGGRRAGR